METRTLAEVRAADADTLYSLLFPERVPAAAVVGCVCLDYLTCTDCERILGYSFVAIERAARKKQRADPPVPVALVDAETGKGLGPCSHGGEGSDAAISGTADRLEPGSRSHPPSGSVEGSDAALSGKADQVEPGSCSHPPSGSVEGSDAALSGKADQLEPGSCSHPPSGSVEGSDAATDRLGTGSHPPSGGVEGSYAAISSPADRLGTGSHPPSDRVKSSDAAAAIPSMADRLGPGSNAGVEGFEAAISGMAARLGLAAAVGDRAKEMYRKMDEARAWPHGPRRRNERSKGRSKGPVAYAACLSIACRNEGSERSLRELALAAAVDGGAAARKEIARLVAHIRRRLGEEEVGHATGIGMVCASSYVRRFGALFGLGEAEEAAAVEAARRLEEGTLDVRHSPESVAAAVVCLALERAGAAREPIKDVATATGIAYDTIYRVCSSLRPHADLIFG